MQLPEALGIAAHVRKALEIAGPYTDVPYTQGQLCEALCAIVKYVGTNPVAHDDHVKITRQLTAANARLAKYERPAAK